MSLFAVEFDQVQEENMQQAEVVAVQAKQIEAIGKDLQDTQKLLSALQSKYPGLLRLQEPSDPMPCILIQGCLHVLNYHAVFIKALLIP